MLDPELLHLLVCPVCRGPLEEEGREGRVEGLLCSACSLVYPLQDGIPVMLKEEAVLLPDWRAARRD